MNDREILENFKDTNWRLESLYKITDKNKKKVLLKPNKVQRVLRSLTDDRILVLKARQFGVSTDIDVRLLDLAMFRENQTNAIMAHKDSAIVKLFRIVKRAYDAIPDCYKPTLDKGGGSMYSLRFPDLDSIIYCDLECRGDTLSNLHGSEVAFMTYERIQASLEAVPKGGKVFFESTANGIGNYFYEMWVEKRSNYRKMFFPWYFDDTEYSIQTTDSMFHVEPTLEEKDLIKKAKLSYKIDITPGQILWRRQKLIESKHLFFQDYPEDDVSCFLTSGKRVFDLVQIKEKLDQLPDYKPDDFGFEIYEPLQRGKTYVCAVDTAQGVGGDMSCASMFCRETQKQVASFRVNLKPSDTAKLANKLCEKYRYADNWPELAVERNNHGHAVLLELEHLNYPNLFQDQDGHLGWKTDSISRPVMMNGFIDAIQDNRFTVFSKDLLQECLTLVNNNGKIEAASGYHDDCVMANAIAIQVCIKNKPRLMKAYI